MDKHPTPKQELSVELRALREALEDDLKRRIVFFPTQEQVNYYHHGEQKLFGDAVYDVFESARKTGKHPLEFAEWGRVCGALKKKVEQLQQRKGRSAHKSMLLQRYASH